MLTISLSRAVRRTAGLVPALALLLAGCESPPADAASVPRAPGLVQEPPAIVVDSARPMPELIHQFQGASGARPDSLERGAPSLEPLVRRYVAALARGDTGVLRSLAVSRAEYAHLIFPGGAMARPPYELDPEVAWLMLSLESEKGVRRAMAFAEGGAVSLAGFDCPEPELADGHRLWRRCTVRVRLNGAVTQPVRLFGQVVEVGGRYKFLSYANALPARQRAN